MSERLTREMLMQMSKPIDIMIPAWDSNVGALEVTIKPVKIRDIAAKVSAKSKKLLEQVEQFQKKYAKYADMTPEELEQTNGHAAFIEYGDLEKIGPYITEIFHQGMVTPKYSDVLEFQDFDFFQKQILLLQIIAASSRDVREMIEKNTE